MSLREKLLEEIEIRTARSSGPGGQHVNKTESKVELYWDLEKSSSLGEDAKSLLRKRLGSKLSKDNILKLSCQESRSQIRNREIVKRRFLHLIEKSLKKEKRRIATRPTKSSVEKRISAKKMHAEKKRRRRPDFD